MRSIHLSLFQNKHSKEHYCSPVRDALVELYPANGCTIVSVNRSRQSCFPLSRKTGNERITLAPRVQNMSEGVALDGRTALLLSGSTASIKSPGDGVRKSNIESISQLLIRPTNAPLFHVIL